MSADVFITGLGVISPAGIGAEETWSALLAGRRAVGPVTCTDLTGCRKTFAGEVPGFTPPAGTSRAHRACQFAVAAAAEAIAAADLKDTLLNPLEAVNRRVAIGTSKPLLHAFTFFGNHLRFTDIESKRFENTVLATLSDAPARWVAARAGITGGTHACATACASGAHAIIRAAQMIQDGDADLVLCGGADASIHTLWISAYERMGVLAPEHPLRGPAFACRPFDRTRAGFAVGEGAAVLVLESGRSARGRGARPIARITGWATGTDPAGLTELSPDGTPLARVIQLACARARCPPQRVTCVYAHGTATVSNDRAETRAIRQALGKTATEVPIASIKGAIGHLMGAAGAVETAMAVLTCRDRLAPGTSTLLEPDPEFGDLTLPRESFQPAAGPVLKTSLGFGGHLAAIIVAPV